MSILKTILFADKIAESEEKSEIINNKNRQINDSNQEIVKLKRELEETKRKLADANINQVPQWKIIEMHKQQARSEEVEREKEYYASLLSKPMLEIAEKSRDFKRTYEKQQAILAQFIIENKAMRELAQSYGVKLGKTDEDFDQELDEAREVVESGNSQFDNNVEPERLKEVARLDEIKKEEKEKEIRIAQQIEDGKKSMDEWAEKLKKDKLEKDRLKKEKVNENLIEKEIEVENSFINKNTNR